MAKHFPLPNYYYSTTTKFLSLIPITQSMASSFCIPISLSTRPNPISSKSHSSFPTKASSTDTSKGSGVIDEDITKIFLKERQENGDFISRVSDILWRGNALKLDDPDTSVLQVNEQLNELVEDDNVGGFLKLTKTREWVTGDDIAPANKRLLTKDWQNDSEKRKKINILQYEAIKRELMLLTIGIGSGCCIYCLVAFSVEAAICYAAGVFFSCLYLQLLYRHADKLSKERVPKIFMLKKLKKIGIRSEDLKNTLEKTFYGSTMALSSPRLVIPAAIYGLWILSHDLLSNFEFELVPAMLGFFAYKAAALVQVYRDNEDLQLILPDSESFDRS